MLYSEGTAKGRQVVFYETTGGRSPVRDFLDGLTHRQRAKVLHLLVMLEEAGFQLGPPWLKKLDEALWELRVLADGVQLRILFCQESDDLVLLHGLRKKQQKLPGKDLATARRRYHDHNARGKKRTSP